MKIKQENWLLSDSRDPESASTNLGEFFTQSEPFPPHHEKLFDHYLDSLYKEAESPGYTPKGVKRVPDRSSKMTKRLRNDKEKSWIALEESLQRNREKDLSEDEKSYLDRTIIKLDGVKLTLSQDWHNKKNILCLSLHQY